jgi:hypothetical protein
MNLERKDPGYDTGQPFIDACDDVLCNILSFCSYKDLARMYSVSKRMNQVASSPFTRNGACVVIRLTPEMELADAEIESLLSRVALWINVRVIAIDFKFDPTPLGGITTLDLSDCTGVADVSALGQITTLDLSGCTGVTDVSAFRKITTLDLSECTGVTNISNLGQITTLNLSGCTGIATV